MTVLNLGCGNRLIKGAVNHDLHKHRPEVSSIWNLNKTPWPWKPNQFDKIVARSVFEHLEIDLIKTLNECWRILKPGGQLRIKVPIFTSRNIRKDPTHRWFWAPAVFDFVDPRTRFGKSYSYYTTCKWRIVSRKIDSKKWNCFVVLTSIK